MPSSMWALVAATIFFVKPTEENAYSRSSIATSMLVVLALHRGVCDKYVPPSPVVTMADRYIYFNLLINVGLAIWGPATTFGVMEGDTQAEHVRQTMDVCFACLLLLLSATFHIWFVYQGCRLASQTHSTLQLRKTGRAMLYRLRKRAFPAPESQRTRTESSSCHGEHHPDEGSEGDRSALAASVRRRLSSSTVRLRRTAAAWQECCTTIPQAVPQREAPQAQRDLDKQVSSEALVGRQCDSQQDDGGCSTLSVEPPDESYERKVVRSSVVL